MLITPQLRAEAAAPAPSNEEGSGKEDAPDDDSTAPKQQVQQDRLQQLQKGAAVEEATAPAAVQVTKMEVVSGAESGSTLAKLVQSIDERWPMNGTPTLKPATQASMQNCITAMCDWKMLLEEAAGDVVSTLCRCWARRPVL